MPVLVCYQHCTGCLCYTSGTVCFLPHPMSTTGQSHVALRTPSNITCIGQNIHIHICAALYSICKWLHLHCSLVPPVCITQADEVCVVCVTLLLHKMWSFVRFERGWCFSSSPQWTTPPHGKENSPALTARLEAEGMVVWYELNTECTMILYLCYVIWRWQNTRKNCYLDFFLWEIGRKGLVVKKHSGIKNSYQLVRLTCRRNSHSKIITIFLY